MVTEVAGNRMNYVTDAYRVTLEFPGFEFPIDLTMFMLPLVFEFGQLCCLTLKIFHAKTVKTLCYCEYGLA